MNTILAGRKFGRLTALQEEAKRKWLVRCDCGNERLVARSDLLNGRSASCGCSRRGSRRWSDKQIEEQLRPEVETHGRMPSTLDVGDVVRMHGGYGTFDGQELTIDRCNPSRTSRSGWSCAIRCPDGKVRRGFDSAWFWTVKP